MFYENVVPVGDAPTIPRPVPLLRAICVDRERGWLGVWFWVSLLTLKTDGGALHPGGRIARRSLRWKSLWALMLNWFTHF